MTLLVKTLSESAEFAENRPIISISIVLKVGSHDPFFGSNYFSGIVSAHRNVDLLH